MIEVQLKKKATIIFFKLFQLFSKEPVGGSDYLLFVLKQIAAVPHVFFSSCRNSTHLSPMRSLSLMMAARIKPQRYIFYLTLLGSICIIISSHNLADYHASFYSICRDSYQVALKYSRKYGADKVRVLTLAKNRGKGGAVRMVRHKQR